MGYLYLLERTEGRSRMARFTFQHEVKIGISNDPPERLASIRKSTPGRVEVIYTGRFARPALVEDALHRRFVCSRAPIKKKRGAKSNGHTEWFLLTWLELLFVYAWLGWYRWRGIFFLIIFIIGLGYWAINYL